MKNELMTRAIGEIDEDLIAEAHDSDSKVEKRHLPNGLYVSRIAMAACFVLVFAAAFFSMRSTDFDVSVNGVSVSEKNGEVAAAEIAFTLPEQRRSVYRQEENAGFSVEIPLEVLSGEKKVKIICTSGTFVINSDGEQCESIAASEKTKIAWIIDGSFGENYELVLMCGKETVCVNITAQAPNEGETDAHFDLKTYRK